LIIDQFCVEKIMKKKRIDLKNLESSSKLPKEFSDALVDAKSGEEEKRGFTKTFVASGKTPASNAT